MKRIVTHLALAATMAMIATGCVPVRHNMPPEQRMMQPGPGVGGPGPGVLGPPPYAPMMGSTGGAGQPGGAALAKPGFRRIGLGDRDHHLGRAQFGPIAFPVGDPEIDHPLASDVGPESSVNDPNFLLFQSPGGQFQIVVPN